MTTQLMIPENDLQLVEIPLFAALTIPLRSTLLTLAETAMPAAIRLRQKVIRLGLDGDQPIQWIYTGVNGDETNEFQVDVAFPVVHPKADCPVGTEFKMFLPFRCMSYTYTGSQADFSELYDQLFIQLYRDGQMNDGQLREVYLGMDAEKTENCAMAIQIKLA